MLPASAWHGRVSLQYSMAEALYHGQLSGRGYAPVSTLKLVGDRWNLTERQRMAVRRSACSDEDRARRAATRLSPGDLEGCELWIDGFNVLTTIEAALGGAVVLRGRDGCDRDLLGLHGTYRKVGETAVPRDDLRGPGQRCGKQLGFGGQRHLITARALELHVLLRG